jgi:hypothetical protein
MASAEILAPGSVFAERFRIIELLAEGEMGAAYVVEISPAGTRCVLKAMAASLVRQAALRKLFSGYAKATSKLVSANILQTKDAGIDRATGRPWFTTDLLRGEDLATRIDRKGPLPLSEVRDLLASVCEGLGKAHAKGLVHYDLTPENVHLASERALSVKLRELTISRLVSDALAAEGELIGTAEWMPPEQFEIGRRLTPAANVWSLALLAFYAATGCVYWKSASDVPSPSKDLLREILGGPLVPASERARAFGCAGLPPWFDAWFARCLVRELSERLPNADAAWALLAESLKQHPGALPDDVDDQATTMRLPDRTGRAKGSRSLPRGIVAEARGGSIATGTAQPLGSVATSERAATKPRAGGGWLYLMALCVGVALLAWLRLSGEHPQPAVGTGSTAASDTMGAPRPSHVPSVTRSYSVDAGGASASAASGTARSDAAVAGGAVAVRTFAADDARGGTDEFDLAAAVKALNGVYYGTCVVPSAGKLAITFAPSGHVKKVAVLKGDYDEATTTCITSRFATAQMPPFRGGEQSLTADVVATR